MDTSTFVAYLDLFIAPILMIMLFSQRLSFVPIIIRTGAAIAAAGLMAQTIVVFTGMDQLNGAGTLWALKDIGLAVFTVGLFFYVCNCVNKKDHEDDKPAS